MIGRVTRGWRIGGLIRYLLGPGRFNEHTDPRVVATWDGRPDFWTPPQGADGSVDVAELAGALAEAQGAAGIPQAEPSLRPDRHGRMRVPRGPVWHCSLRNHPDDPVLTDRQWAQIAREVLHRTGIAPRGDEGGCRWVVVRHADDHVHIAAVLVRLDTGARVYPQFDYPKLRAVCREAEARLGLIPTGDADRTAPCHPTRAEREKAARQAAERGPERDPNRGQPARVVLTQAARRASVQARTPDEFFELLKSELLRVRVHRDAAGEIDGYALALFWEHDADGTPIWYSASSLARDLSMPRLRAVWASADQPAEQLPPEPNERHRPGRAERLGAVHEATEAVHAAANAVHAARQRTNDGPGAARDEGDYVHDRVHDDPASAALHDGPVHGDESVHTSVHGPGTSDGDTEPADGVAHSLRDLLIALDLTAHHAYPELGDAARLFDRAARNPRALLPDRWSEEARYLRTAAWRLSAVKALPARGAGREPLAALVAAIATLVAELAAYQATKQRLAQARAARYCAATLAEAGERHRLSKPPPDAGARGQRTSANSLMAGRSQPPSRAARSPHAAPPGDFPVPGARHPGPSSPGPGQRRGSGRSR